MGPNLSKARFYASTVFVARRAGFKCVIAFWMKTPVRPRVIALPSPCRLPPQVPEEASRIPSGRTARACAGIGSSCLWGTHDLKKEVREASNRRTGSDTKQVRGRREAENMGLFTYLLRKGNHGVYRPSIVGYCLVPEGCRSSATCIGNAPEAVPLLQKKCSVLRVRPHRLT